MALPTPFAALHLKPYLLNALPAVKPLHLSSPPTLHLRRRRRRPHEPPRPPSLSLPAAPELLTGLFTSSPPTWISSAAANLAIFVVGSPLLATGLSPSGAVTAFLLGTLTWRAFGPPGFTIVAAYFVVGTAATKLKMAQKEAMGVAEKKSGRRGPGSVIGSSFAGCVCAILSIGNVGGHAFLELWQLGFVSNFCTKLSDTVSSEVGKAYGKNTYLVTTFRAVPRGTEGAVSLEGTIAGLLASALLSAIAYFTGEVSLPQVGMCILASQIANFGESLIGATLQERAGFQWLTNDVVNVINISLGCILAILLQLSISGFHAQTI